MTQAVRPDKNHQMSIKVAQKLTIDDFTRKVMFFKRAQKSQKTFGLLLNEICSQELSKIAQSGHTGERERVCDSRYRGERVRDSPHIWVSWNHSYT